ncbi:hypothetical protein ACN9MD_09525 [Stenotrophomonas maltophilia]|uniref:hypothetical protein n=1 Tax=Stenotrophomonas maltophilia TaxID=40324 RepID=UPI003CF121FC
MSTERIPDPVTEQERWIAGHYVDAVKVEYRQTGIDTAQTYVTLIAGKEKVTWKDSTFRKVARLELSNNTLVEPNYGVREKVKAREAWERANEKELAEYKRLKEKFEKGVPDGRG